VGGGLEAVSGSLPVSSNPTARVVMDEAYYRTFHAEMVATRRPNGRRPRAVGVVFVILGTVFAVALVGMASLAASGAALFVAGFGVWSLRRLNQRRERWLAYQRRLPIFGATVIYELDGGRILQRADRKGDVLGIPAGEVIGSRSGWFITYDVVHLGTRASDEAISTDRASAWIPHTFDPPVSRDEVAARLSETFSVKRW